MENELLNTLILIAEVIAMGILVSLRGRVQHVGAQITNGHGKPTETDRTLAALSDHLRALDEKVAGVVGSIQGVQSEQDAINARIRKIQAQTAANQRWNKQQGIDDIDPLELLLRSSQIPQPDNVESDDAETFEDDEPAPRRRRRRA